MCVCVCVCHGQSKRSLSYICHFCFIGSSVFASQQSLSLYLLPWRGPLVAMMRVAVVTFGWQAWDVFPRVCVCVQFISQVIIWLWPRNCTIKFSQRLVKGHAEIWDRKLVWVCQNTTDHNHSSAAPLTHTHTQTHTYTHHSHTGQRLDKC